METVQGTSNTRQKLYAAVKFYADAEFMVVPVEKIKNFSIQQSYSKSYLITRPNKITQEEGKEPAQILAVSGTYNCY